MASVTAEYRYADGEVVTAKGASSYPDALNQLRREAFDGWADAVAYALAIQGEAEGEGE